MVFPTQSKDFSHVHSSPPLDLLIEIEKRSSQLPRRSLADRCLPDSRKSDENQVGTR